MKPVEPIGAPGELVVIAKDQPEYQPLPSHVDLVDVGTVYTRWQLSWRERLAVALGRHIDLNVLTFGRPLQPLQISVEGLGPEPEAPDA